jgi:hypothetical protein
MILILILSLVAACYIAFLADLIVDPERRTPQRKAAGLKAVSGASTVLTPGLVALGSALDQYGRGREPLPAMGLRGEEVRKTERDRL